MWNDEHTAESAATPAAVYRCYEEHGLRTQWDAGLQEVTLDGPFAAGTAGVMVIDGQGAFQFTIVAADPCRLFVDETVVANAGVTLRFDHLLEARSGGVTWITHRLTVTGPNVDQVGEEIGRMVTADFPTAMTALARLAESVS